MKRGPELFGMMYTAWRILILCFLCSVSLSAQSNDTSNNPSTVVSTNSIPLSVEKAKQLLEELEQNSQLESTVKENLGKLYQGVVAFAEKTQTEKQMALQYSGDIQNAPQLLTEVSKALKEDLPSPIKEELSETTSVADLEKLLKQIQAEQTTAKERQKSSQDEIKRRTERIEEILTTTATTKAGLNDVELKIKATRPPEELPEVTRATQLLMRAERDFHTQLLERLDLEAKKYEAEKDLQNALLEQETRKVNQLSKIIDDLNTRLGEARKREADAVQEQAKRQQEEIERFMSDLPELKKLADRNLSLVATRTGTNGVSAKLTRTQEKLGLESKELERLLSEYQSTTNRVLSVESMGFRIDTQLGTLLRLRLGKLPNYRSLQDEVKQNLREITRIETASIGASEDLVKLGDLNATYETYTNIIVVHGRWQESTDWQKNLILDKTRKLIEDERSYLSDLNEEYQKYSSALEDLEQTQRSTIDLVRTYIDFVKERIFWVRSEEPINWSNVIDSGKAVQDLFSSTIYPESATVLLQDYLENSYSYIAILVVWLVLVIARYKLIHKLDATSAIADEKYNTRFLPTISALLTTIILAAPLPLLAWLIGNRLNTLSSGDFEIIALSKAFVFVAVLFFTLEFLRQLCRPNGLGEKHLHWNSNNIRLLNRHVKLLMYFGLPFAFVETALATNQATPAHGQLGFVIGMGLMSYFGHSLLHPKRGLKTTSRRGAGFHKNPKFIILQYAIAVVFPLLLGIAAYIGYFYTVLELFWRLLTTLWLFLAVFLINECVFRWLFLSRRRLILDQLETKRAALAEAQQTTQSQPAPASDPVLQQQPEDELDPAEVHRQNKQLFETITLFAVLIGLWAIWVEVLPALNVLDRVQLWQVERVASISSVQEVSVPLTQSTNIVDGQNATTALAPTLQSPETVFRWITLHDVCFALLVLCIFLIASKNIPGILEISLLRHMSLQPGSGYAITTMIRYLITLVGIIVAFNLIGVTWQKVQWLAAAVTLGIGFGLQEIFANFVSGLIIFFEKPIRVGDVVETGTISGRVTRIQIRATTIADWDNKELIIPNKEFITGRVHNWTLSDGITRVVFGVGVAYGADLRKAKEILLKIGREHPKVSKEKNVNVIFQGFGDNSINFDLRVFIDDLDYIIRVKNDIGIAIFEELSKAGIEIAFPQRDIHIKSVPKELARLNRSR
jgi:potassium-dependent mechanosensitive channel